jgi:hypothetical protein
MTTTRARRTLRYLLCEAEQTRSEITLQVLGMTHQGVVRDVGVGYVTIDTHTGPVDCALFHVVSMVG